MGKTLKHEAFSRLDRKSLPASEHLVVRREDDFACKVVARIIWQADSIGKLTDIRGEYREEGCL